MQNYTHRFPLTVALLAAFLLSAEQSSADDKTTIGGYGNAVYSRNFDAEVSTADLERFVLFFGHEFSQKISLVSELEMEDAKVSGGDAGGEIAFEQAYLRFTLDAGHSLVAGLFLPRMGILNENHLPTSFNGNERTQVETFIIPSTWRELGVGFYGSNDVLPVEYSIAIVNGLNASGFSHGSVIREGRFEGRNASANNIALTGSIAYSTGNARMQVSGYYGGSVGLPPAAADSLRLRGGAFGTPVALGEADVQFSAGPFAFRLLGTLVSIPDAAAINAAFGNNTPKSAYGAYAETAYTVKSLTVFVRYEKLDMNSSLPANGTYDGTLNQNHLITGVSFVPLENIVVKADIRFTRTASAPAAQGNQETTFLTVGFGFSF